jgi:FkbM family methyltransferase
MFYEQGWRGVHVEPNIQYYELLRKSRPDETVLNVACSDRAGLIDFYAVADTGMSTASKDAAGVVERHGWATMKMSAPAVTLDDILDRVDQPEIHWMKIDVEGFEEPVLRGWRRSARRPWIVVVEAIAPLTHEPNHEAWEPLLLAKGYVFTYFDGLNRYYALETHPELQRNLAYGPGVWDDFEVPEDSRRAATLIQRHKAELSDARAAQAASAAEIAAYDARANELAASLGEADGALKEAREQLSFWRAELERAWGALGRAHDASIQVRGDLDRTVGELAEVRSALAGTQDERSTAQRHLVETRHAWDLAQIKLNQTLATLTETRDALERTAAERDRARGQVAETQAALRQAVEERDRTSERLAETSDRLVDASGRLIETSGLLAETSGRLIEAERDLSVALAQLAEARGQFDQASRDLRQMAADLSQARALADQLAAELQDQRDLVAQQRESVAAAQAEATATLHGLNNANAQIARLQDLIDASRLEEARLSAALREVVESRWWRAAALFRRTSKVAGSAASAPAPAPAPAPATSVQELLAHDGKAFLRRAYVTLLGREVEPEGLAAHLPQLRKMGREKVLCAIASSEEGRRFGASLPGLDALVARIAPAEAAPSTSLAKMLSLHDENFVRNAYAVLLGREPDPRGLHSHLAHLRVGAGRFAILAEMRLSAEGRGRDPRVSGLDAAIRSYRRRRVPGLGHALRWAGKGLERARIRRKLSMIETQLDLLEQAELTAALFPPQDAPPSAANDTAPVHPPRAPEHGRLAAFNISPPPTPPLDWRIEYASHVTLEPFAPDDVLSKALVEIGHRLAPTANAVVARRIASHPPQSLDLTAGGLLTNFDWGETGLPAGWAEQLNAEFEGIACVSMHAQKILVDNGVTTPIVATGLGVDHWETQIPAPDYKAPGKGFKFLHVSDCGLDDGVDLLLEAFGRLFDNDDPVSLIIVPTRPDDSELRRRLEQMRRINLRFPDVVIERSLDAARLKALYQQSDAFLAPSRASGFNLPLALALVSEKPVVATAWGGHLDYCNDANAWLVDYAFQRARTDHNLAVSAWAEPIASLLDEQIWAVYRATSAERAARAGAGRRDLLARFTWAHVASRLARLAHDAKDRAGAEPLRRQVGWVTTWKVRCGIASHIANMLGAISAEDVVIFAADDADVLGADEPNCLRSWTQGKGENDLHRILSEAKARSMDSLVIQFNYGFFNHAELDRFIDTASSQGMRVLIDLHSTIDPRDLDNFRLRDFLDGLHKCYRILAHGPNDLNRLKALGLVDNVMLFPLGVMRQSAPPPARAMGSTPLISSFGFAFANKGLPELVQAVALLKQQGTRVRLRMLNAEHSNPESGNVIRSLRAMVQELGLQDDVELRTEYLDDDICLALLGEADLVVNPYQQTGESASAAVRYGVTSGAPVTVTPLAIFDDLGDAVFRMPGMTPEQIAHGVASALRDIQEASPAARSVREAARRWIEAHDVALQGVRLMRTARAIAS